MELREGLREESILNLQTRDGRHRGAFVSREVPQLSVWFQFPLFFDTLEILFQSLEDLKELLE